MARKTGETKMRGIRVSDFDWRRFEAAAALSGESVSEYLRGLGRREAERRLGPPDWTNEEER
jgi:hypothetical protein